MNTTSTAGTRLPVSVQIRERVTEIVGPDDIAKASSPSTKMLLALAATGKHLYQGTVPGHVVSRRRAANKRARAARKAARR